VTTPEEVKTQPDIGIAHRFVFKETKNVIADSVKSKSVRLNVDSQPWIDEAPVDISDIGHYR